MEADAAYCRACKPEAEEKPHGAVQVCNAYGAGLTDWDMASLYGKLCIFAFAAWAGNHGGVTAGLAVCGIMLSVTTAAAGAQPSLPPGMCMELPTLPYVCSKPWALDCREAGRRELLIVENDA